MPSGYAKNGVNGGQFKKGVYLGFGFKKGHKIRNRTKGTKLSLERRHQMSIQRMGNKYAFLGEAAGYAAKHLWMEKQFGKAKDLACMFCGGTAVSPTTKKNSTRIEWANLDGKYTRNPFSWTTLCKICHMRYDRDVLGAKIGKPKKF